MMTTPRPKSFPFTIVLATFAALFAFLGLTALVSRSPNYLDDTKASPQVAPNAEPKVEPETRLRELRAKNQAVLDGKPGTGTKMSVADATNKVLATLKSEKDHLPFPTPEPPAPVVPKGKK